MPDGEILQTRAQHFVHLGTPRLIQLPLRCDSCYLRSWTSPLREPSMSPMVVACDRIYLFGEGRWRVWIGERKETEVCDFEVAQESGRSSSRSEVEEVLIVIVDYERQWCQSQ